MTNAVRLVSSMDEFEALPCPFCGKKPKWYFSYDDAFYHHWHGLFLCRGWIVRLYCDWCDGPGFFGRANTKREGGNALAQQAAMKEALRKWNRRS